MAQLSVSARAADVVLAACGGDPAPGLARLIDRLPDGAPIAILIHGWRFDPGIPRHDPHRLLFAPRPARASRRFGSWPGGLGFSPDDPADGLAIGFGWGARAPHLPHLLRGRTGFAAVYDRAGEAGAALAVLIGRIAALAPGRRVDILAHSLGARVALAALPHLDAAGAAALDLMLLLGGAEFAGRAAAALAASRARPQVLSFAADWNAPFDGLFALFAPRGPGADRVLSRGGPEGADWLTLRLDAPGFVAWAADRGIVLGAMPAVCHWSFYTRPGVLALQSRILRDRTGFSPAVLRSATAPVVARRIAPAA